jgi:arylsulfatase
VLGFGLLLGCGGAAPERPNLLLISVDTLRADALECYSPDGAGADLCALFEDGTRYEWAFSTAPYTAPAIASLITSQYPAQHGLAQAIASYLRPEVTTVAEALSAAGYATAAVVSNPVLHSGRNLAQGFDHYDAEMTRTERNRPGFAEREARGTTDAALAWLATGAQEPWFLWVHYQDPHGPYLPPEGESGSDPAEAAPLPLLADESGRGGIPAYQALPGLRSVEGYRARYRAEIEYLTQHLVRLVEGAAADGPPPALLLTADHGEAFGEDGYYLAHGHSLGLDQIRVPLLVRGPGARSARSVRTPVSLIDVGPTLLALAGVEAPPEFRGRPLPQADTAPPRPIFAEHDRRAAVVAEGRFYSRNRNAKDGGAQPRKASAGSLGGLYQELAALPPRVHELAEGDTYREPEPKDQALEEQLRDYVARTRESRGVRHERVSDEVRDRMRALGYVVD